MNYYNRMLRLNAPSNNSFNPSRISSIFIRETRMLDTMPPAGLIRALDAFLLGRIQMFNVAYRRVINPDLPEAVRFLALLWCIESYGWLTGQKFGDTYLRLGKEFGFNWVQKPNGLQLTDAVNLLMAERSGFLKKLEVFSETREKEKAKGQRQPRKNQREMLYHPDWLLTSAAKELGNTNGSI